MVTPCLDLKGYEAKEGYAALRKALKEMTPQDVQLLVKDANLRGRGGAGFPAGVKWSLIPMGPDAGPNTSSATPTKWSRAPSRTAC
jgi:NADH-quinone oxidoreductase subunit F